MINLNLADIQGNIHRPYGRFGFPHSRHVFFRIEAPRAGRKFILDIAPRITTAEPWDKVETADGSSVVLKPPITLNIGFTFLGLHALDLPTRTLRMLPDEFIDGMAPRAEILGDLGDSAPERWDLIWNKARAQNSQAHVWVSLNAGAQPDGAALPILTEWTDWLVGLAKSCDGVTLLAGHGADGKGLWQDSCSLMAPGADGAMVPQATEHFGFTDGISDPVFKGQFAPDAESLASIGGGKIAPGTYHQDSSWGPLELGEFILGHVDEAQEFPMATHPQEFARNGTFMVWRKLCENVEAFEADMARQADLWMKVTGVADRQEAEETVRAKIVGRWRSGIPLMNAPTWADNQRLVAEYADCLALTLKKSRDSKEQQRLAEYAKLLTGFRYGDDPDGKVCPLGAHVRRAFPRDMLDPELSAKVGSTTLTNRRRILRRGAPYADPTGERGVIFMAVCASLFRQFEFIQQQWMNYGLDFEAGNDTCPLVGNHGQSTKHVIPAGPANAATVIAADLPQFVSTRGGDYFFIPSMSAIRMIAMGTVDPT